ncbi:hypothetical protein ACEPPN_008484 [Leptodophora sp. 'Broadleaf-Isolate-01']
MDNQGYTALMIACENGDAKVAEVLISRGADVNLKLPAGHEEGSILGNGIGLFPEGKTALMMAATKGREKIVSLLTEAGLEMDSRDANGQTAMLAAALKGRSSVVQYLFNHGGSVTAKTNAGLGILTIAVRTRSLVLMSFLASLHEQAMRDEPPRLIFGSGDSGEALQFAVITIPLSSESLEFKQTLRIICYDAWGFQREHQAKHTALERQRLEAD